MIHTNIFPPVVMKLQASSFMFYLTGSRHFGNVNSASDWDFFVRVGDDVRKFLSSAGFWITNDGMYNGRNSAEVWYADNVHVQLVQDITAKIRAQAIIPVLFPNYTKQPKHVHRMMWDHAYQVIETLDKV